MHTNKAFQQLNSRARAMRKEPAPAEARLWARLRDRQLQGFRFRRQHSLSGYIADFYCAECKLIVELDGDSHSERADEDAKRTAEFERFALKVIRFVNTDVFENVDAVLNAILAECESRQNPSPRPSPLSGERE